ncbi:T7SS effector LXG polymorphic toxin [Bacillus atrophaeus]|uniref:T7SS effector LXG polymorphic toxin n=1 Tax=Bacillus atrophaeus TaxID=1452 RepID=UPI00359C8218
MPSGPSTRSATSLFLLFFGMFIDEYKKVLKQTQHRISSVESDSHGLIAEVFLHTMPDMGSSIHGK